MSRRLRSGVVFAALVCVATPKPGLAAHDGGDGLFDVQSADVPVSGSISAGVTGVGYRIHHSQEPGAVADRTVWDGGVQLGGGLGGWLEAWTRFDATLYSNRDQWPIAPSDGSLGAKIALPWHGKWLRTGISGRANLPWGNRARGLSTGSVDPNLTALVTIPLPESNTFTNAKLHFNVGYQWHGDDRGRGFDGKPLYYLEPVYPDQPNQDRVDLRAAIEFGSERVTLFAEVLLDQLRSDDLAFAESPIFVTPGFRMRLGESLSLLAGSKIALAHDDESTTRYRPPEDFYPDWQFAFGLTWTKQGPEADRDGDGVPDFRDRCPHEAEDLDGFQDDDGCPEFDNDADGIPDAFDQAPNAPEDLDGYLDSDGVPDPDNDGDGILDVVDDCPDLAEDLDGIDDDDGCPEE